MYLLLAIVGSTTHVVLLVKGRRFLIKKLTYRKGILLFLATVQNVVSSSCTIKTHSREIKTNNWTDEPCKAMILLNCSKYKFCYKVPS